MNRPERTRGWHAGLARPACALAAILVAVGITACGGSTAGLIPSSDATSLKRDFEAVAQAAQKGSCKNTEIALQQAQADFRALPAGLKAALRARLQQGIANLSTRALAKCLEVTATTSSTTTTRTTTTEQTVVVTTTTVASSSQEPSQPVTTSTPSESANGGAAAPQESGGEGAAEGPEGAGAGGAGGAGGR